MYNPKEKKIIIFSLFLCLLCGSLWVIGCFRDRPTTNSGESNDYIDSLEFVIKDVSKTTDSIRERVDTIYKELDASYKQYEEDFNNIINNNINEDLIFFLDYIESNRARLDSINKSL